mmetsp:Transcript_2171/g.3406  ORF Transcript_2171/g.3406 Transcript_2171/m.3406 type:complete len:85 (-) Transcript_2171:93-347(-)
MFHLRRAVIRNSILSKRLSTGTSPTATVAASATPKKGGSSFFQRLSSFLAGCGVGFGVSFYFIYNELSESNEKLERSIKQMEGK